MHDLRCENYFCVYWVNGACELDSVELDVQGSCESCIYATFTEDELERARISTLERLKS